MKRYLIAHDLGTSGNKATLFDIDGRMIDSITQSYGTNFFKGNYAEQNPNDWWEAVCSSTKKLLGNIDKNEVISVSFSGQMMGCVLVDRKGQLLRNAIIWSDMRSVKEEEYLRSNIDEQEVYHITGTKITAAYSLEKLMWIKNNEPDIYAKTYKMLLPKDYIVYKLTGNLMTDYSDASCTNAFDINKLEWSEKMLDAAGISADKMPDVHESTYLAGGITDEAAKACGLLAGTKVILGAGDGPCATVGAMSVNKGDYYASMGSSAWISFTSDKPVFDEEMRTFNFLHLIPGMYVPTGTMQAAGNSFGFMKRVLCDGLEMTAKSSGQGVYDLMNDEIFSSPVGSNGLLYLPYLLGERSPRWNPYARGSFIGLKMEHNKADMLRASVEGIMMNLDIVLNIFKKKVDVDSINVVGGLVKGPAICDILTDVWGIRANKLDYLEEATSMGAALAAGVGAGVLEFSDIGKFNSVNDVIEPNLENNKKYEPYKSVFDDSYYALLDIFDKMAKLK